MIFLPSQPSPQGNRQNFHIAPGTTVVSWPNHFADILACQEPVVPEEVKIKNLDTGTLDPGGIPLGMMVFSLIFMG